MRALLPAAALLFAAGCGPSYDPTGDPPGGSPAQGGLDACTAAPAGRSCITLHLTGETGPIDTLQVDATFELGGKDWTRRVVIVRPEGPAPPPIAAGVILAENAGENIDLKVLASLGGAPVGLAKGYVFDLYPGAHDHASLALTKAAHTRCFNGIEDGGEHGVDCGWGSDCPACPGGSACLLDQDCADGACARVSDGQGGHDYRCQ